MFLCAFVDIVVEFNKALFELIVLFKLPGVLLFVLLDGLFQSTESLFGKSSRLVESANGSIEEVWFVLDEPIVVGVGDVCVGNSS